MKRSSFSCALIACGLLIACSDATDDPGSEIGDPHLAAYYPFTGNAGDSSGHESHGNVSGPVLTPDRHGNPDAAYTFDSYDDYITVSDTNNFRWTEQITLSAWMRPDSQRSQIVFRKGGGLPVPLYELGLAANGTILFKLQNNFVVTSGYALNTWTHIAGTYDGQMMRLYVNGIARDSLAVLNALAQDGSLLLIGTRSGMHADTFGGALDEIRIYDIALSSEEVSALAK